MSTQSLKLWEHVDQMQVVLDWLEEHDAEIQAADGAIPPELEELLEQAEGDLRQKVERTALVIQNLAANAAAAKVEAQRLSALAATYERQAASLKNYLKLQLHRAGLPRVDTPLAKIRIQRNSRASLRLADGVEIPAEFQRVRIEFDSAAAYDALKGAGRIPTEPGTYYVEGTYVVELGDHLRIQ